MGISWAEAAERGRRMAKDYRSGMNLEQVAEKHGVTSAAVHRRLKNLGVKMRRGGQPRTFPALDVLVRLLRGETAKAIAEDRGCTPENIWICLYRRGIRGSELSQWRPILDMDERAFDVLRMALDDDRLLMEDAYEIAIEYQPKRRAA